MLSVAGGFDWDCELHTVPSENTLTPHSKPFFCSNDPEKTQGEMWLLCALSGRLGLSYTMRKTLRGHKVNEDWMTWECPAELMGKVWTLDLSKQSRGMDCFVS